MTEKKRNKSWDNLDPIRDAKVANERREKGLLVRMENKRIREENADKIAEEKIRMKALAELSEEGMSAYDIMKVNMISAQINGNTDEASRLAKELAPYEKPKLSSQELVSTIRSARDLSDDELAEMASLALIQGGKA